MSFNCVPDAPPERVTTVSLVVMGGRCSMLSFKSREQKIKKCDCHHSFSILPNKLHLMCNTVDLCCNMKHSSDVCRSLCWLSILKAGKWLTIPISV